MYPEAGITKAQVIQYYMKIAPILLRYIGSRPLTVIRYPDGIGAKSFYSKDKPKWTPDWIESKIIKHETKSIDYIIANNKAALVWLANLACLELHPMQFKVQSEFCPDHFVIDLDPDEDLEFDAVRETALALKQYLESLDFTPFVKTSGGKGFHIVVPIVADMTYEKVTRDVKTLAARFVASNPRRYTLSIAKNSRKGKVLIDIYRNHLTNTTIAPYSLRGKSKAPISMPLTWQQVESIVDARVFNISNYQEQLDQYGDLWQDWYQYAVPMHSDRRVIGLQQVDERLKDYLEKRDFEVTSEPLPEVMHEDANRYVVQLHDASTLHYDLRLEQNGVLMSWAIPKGLPLGKDVKRLAIRTEDHPIKYLHFEGEIPKGQYGAGQMLIVDTGIIEWLSKRDNQLTFKLIGKIIGQTYVLNKMHKKNQWLIQTYQQSIPYELDQLYTPMLASAAREVPVGSDLSYEVKWDGIRAMIYIYDREVKIISRSGRDISHSFPELCDPQIVKVEHAVLDGEIVVLDQEGRPMFHEVISRMHLQGAAKISHASRAKPVVFYAFDLLTLDGLEVIDMPLAKRRSWLNMILRSKGVCRISRTFEDGSLLFNAIQEKQMEGIIAKRDSSRYHIGQRTEAWVKVKCRYEVEVYIVGYTKGKGDRSKVFGALHLAVKSTGDSFVYKGKVGTGFDDKKLRDTYQQIKGIKKSHKLFDTFIEEEHNTVWIEPRLQCKIEYASLSSNDTYREPVFISMVA